MPQAACQLTPSRETAPPSFQRWIVERADQFAQCEERFRHWLECIAESEDAFRKHVYENPKVKQVDFRQHRQGLFWLLSVGENIATDFQLLGEQDRSGHYIGLIDVKCEELFHTLLEWHMPVNFKDQVPDSFKRGMQDIADGKVVPMEKALNERP